MPREAGISVPAPYRKPFSALATLDEEIAREVEAAADNPALTTRAAVTSAIEAAADGAIDAAALVGAFLSLAGLRRGTEPDAAEIAELIASSQDFQLDEKLRQQLAHRLTRLLLAHSVRLLTRAYDLATEHAATFIDAREVSDVRAVFLTEPPGRPDGAIIVQTLKLEFLTTEQQSLYKALSGDDIETLLQVLKKAQAKQDRLRELLEEARTPIVELSAGKGGVEQ
jgi:hypothetical protein